MTKRVYVSNGYYRMRDTKEPTKQERRFIIVYWVTAIIVACYCFCCLVSRSPSMRVFDAVLVGAVYLFTSCIAGVFWPVALMMIFL
jgi:hypothetical protein